MPPMPNAIFTPTLYSLIVPVLGSTHGVISFISSPVISLIVFFASSSAAQAAPVQHLSELSMISIILAT